MKMSKEQIRAMFAKRAEEEKRREETLKRTKKLSEWIKDD